MTHEIDQLNTKDQVSNQFNFSVLHVAVCMGACVILSISYRPICASSKSKLLPLCWKHLLFTFKVQLYTLYTVVGVFMSQCLHQELLPGNVLSLTTSIHTLFTLHHAQHQQEGRKGTKTPLPVCTTSMLHNGAGSAWQL